MLMLFVKLMEIDWALGALEVDDMPSVAAETMEHVMFKIFG